jgi:uncharacterized protein involved in tolerance to divalent cations
MLQGVAKCYAQKLGTKNVIAFFPRKTQKKIIYVWHGSCSIYRYKKERMKMMKKTVQNSVKRMKNERNRQVAYNMPIVSKDMKKNDEMVRKFFESMKG